MQTISCGVSMHWDFYCPGCDQLLQGRPGEEHTYSRCPGCHAHFRTPGPPPPPPPVVPYESANGMRNLWWLSATIATLLVIGVGYVGWRYLPRWKAAEDPPATLPFLPDSGELKRGRHDPPPRRREEEEPRIFIDRTQSVPELPLDQPAMRVVGNLGPCLALALSPNNGPIISSTPDGELRIHDGTTLEVRSRFQLSGPAYELRLDSERGRLYAVLGRTAPAVVRRMGYPMRTEGDLALFDLSAALQVSSPVAGELKPLKVFPFLGELADLVLTPDGKRLYCLSQTDRQLSLVLIDPIAGKDLGQITISSAPPNAPGGRANTGLAVAPDEDVVYLINGIRLMTIQADLSKEVGRPVQAPLLAYPVALPAGQLMLIELPFLSSSATRVLVVSMRTQRLLQTWQVRVTGLPAFAASVDGKTLWLSTSAVLGGSVLVLKAASTETPPEVVGHYPSSPENRIRGRLFVSPDGARAALSNGLVLQRP